MIRITAFLKHNKRVISIITLAIVLIFTPILIFIIQFRDYSLSKNLTDWAYFATYINGIMAVASFFIISYLTYIVSKFSSEENKKLNLLNRRLDAFNEISKSIAKVTPAMREYTNSFKYHSYIVNNTNIENDPDHMRDMILKNIELIHNVHSIFIELSSSILYFNLKYGHLFKYNFDCKEFKELIDIVEELSKYYEFSGEGEKLIHGKSDETEKLVSNFEKVTTSVLNDLRKELK